MSYLCKKITLHYITLHYITLHTFDELIKVNMSKKILLFVACHLFVWSISLNETKAQEDTAQIVGESISNIFLNLNSLSESDFCELNSIMSDSMTSDSFKLVLIRQNLVLSQFYDNTLTLFENLLDYNSSIFINIPTNFNNVVDVFENELGEDFVPIDGCGGWKAGRRVCNANYTETMAQIAVGCGFIGPGYWICALTMTAFATNTWFACHAANDMAYPSCSGTGGGVTINPWIQAWDNPGNGGYCD